jgi:predicted dehydrogenase
METRLAMIGAGIVAELYAKAFERGVVGAKFVGVFDPVSDRAEKFATRLDGQTYQSREELLTDSAIDAVLVLSPNVCHFDDACSSLLAGKHVLVEKPVAQTREQLHELEQVAAGVGKTCMPAHNYIYMEPVIRMRRMLDGGRFGTLASIWILYNIFHSEEIARHYGGVLREVAVHHAYSLLFLAGKPCRVSAHKSCVHYATMQEEDQVMLTCEMRSGAIANLWVSFAASDHTSDPWTVLYKILGTKGGASFSWNDALVEDEGGPAWGITNYVDSFHTELTHFISTIMTGDQPLSTLEDARDALAIVEAAERSLEKEAAYEAVIY